MHAQLFFCVFQSLKAKLFLSLEFKSYFTEEAILANDV